MSVLILNVTLQELVKAQLAGTAELAAAHIHLKQQSEKTATELAATKQQLHLQMDLFDRSSRAALEKSEKCLHNLKQDSSELNTG